MRYQLLLRLLLPVFLVLIWWKGRREPAWREGVRQRFGALPARSNRPLWIHAASVGEANSAAGLFRYLKTHHPHLPLHLTAFTPTGLDRLQALVPEATVSFLPLDLPLAVERFLGALQPRAAVMLETECWPNLLLACHQRTIPVVWLSGRMSERSLRQYPRLFGRHLLRHAFAPVAHFGMQTEADRQRFAALGAPAARLCVTGTLKYDVPLPEGVEHSARALREEWGRSAVWLAASTHPGEEETVLDAHRQMLERDAQALLVLAPRHPRRRDEVLALIRARKLRVVCRSDQDNLQDAQVLLVDTLGELMLFYAACDLAFVGGSLVRVGGHNLLEPAALGRPIITGPHLQNCQDMADALLNLDAIKLVSDARDLARVLEDFATTPELWRDRGAAAQAFAQANRGALGRSVALIEAYLRA